ncbi:hypothetical protein TNCT_293191 [Trichonephila clavata]|uniref:Uncharacterized protein n=1 Tax=Trichonephila clavata TaxID=2740835 RepID=A0A8X6LS70_TRICU|nr:hypothetical protein TNCT_293191 [Trichonephila clavata]
MHCENQCTMKARVGDVNDFNGLVLLSLKMERMGCLLASDVCLNSFPLFRLRGSFPTRLLFRTEWEDCANINAYHNSPSLRNPNSSSFSSQVHFKGIVRCFHSLRPRNMLQ